MEVYHELAIIITTSEREEGAGELRGLDDCVGVVVISASTHGLPTLEFFNEAIFWLGFNRLLKIHFHLTHY